MVEIRNIKISVADKKRPVNCMALATRDIDGGIIFPVVRYEAPAAGRKNVNTLQISDASNSADGANAVMIIESLNESHKGEHLKRVRVRETVRELVQAFRDAGIEVPPLRHMSLEYRREHPVRVSLAERAPA